MFSKLIAIASLALAANAAVIDPSDHTVQYEAAPGKVVTEHYEVLSHAEASRIIEANPHISDYRYRCNYQCNDSSGNYMRNLQQGVPNQACIFSSCYDCDWKFQNCSYCRLSTGHNYRDIGGLESWCYNNGGTTVTHNCGYTDGDQC